MLEVYGMICCCVESLRNVVEGEYFDFKGRLRHDCAMSFIRQERAEERPGQKRGEGEGLRKREKEREGVKMGGR